MGKTFTTAAILDGVTPRKDGSLTLRFVTQEVSKEDIVATMEYYQSMGHLLFSENEVSIKDVPEGNAILDGGKSPSKRLKDRMFVCYRENKIGDSSGFDKWYTQQLEKVGSQYLERVKR